MIDVETEAIPLAYLDRVGLAIMHFWGNGHRDADLREQVGHEFPGITNSAYEQAAELARHELGLSDAWT